MKKLILLILLSTSLFAKDLIPYDSNYEKIKKIVTVYNKQDQYSDNQLKEMSRLLDIASMQYGVSFYKLLAQIAIESRFDRYHFYKNKNGSTDIGLMQSNSEHIPERCQKLFKRNCTTAELLDPVISIKIAFYRYNECSKYSNDAFFICYNNDNLAYKYLTSDFYPDYLDKLYKEYDIIIRELMR